MTTKRTVVSYPTRQIRISDEVWKKFEENKKKSGLTWNKYIHKLLKEEKN